MKHHLFIRPDVGAALGIVALSVAVPFTAACAQTQQAEHAAQAPVSSAPLTAFVSQAGQITIRQADSDSALVTITPRLFEKGWQLRSLGTSGKGFADDNGRDGLDGTIAAPQAGAIVAVRTAIRTDGHRLIVTSTMTADKDVAIESAFIGLNVPVAAVPRRAVHAGHGKRDGPGKRRSKSSGGREGNAAPGAVVVGALAHERAGNAASG